MDDEEEMGEGEDDSDVDETQNMDCDEPQTPCSTEPAMIEPTPISKPATPVGTTKPPAQSGQKPPAKSKPKAKTKRKSKAHHNKRLSPNRFRV